MQIFEEKYDLAVKKQQIVKTLYNSGCLPKMGYNLSR